MLAWVGGMKVSKNLYAGGNRLAEMNAYSERMYHYKNGKMHNKNCVNDIAMVYGLWPVDAKHIEDVETFFSLFCLRFVCKIYRELRIF